MDKSASGLLTQGRWRFRLERRQAQWLLRRPEKLMDGVQITDVRNVSQIELVQSDNAKRHDCRIALANKFLGSADASFHCVFSGE